MPDLAESQNTTELKIRELFIQRLEAMERNGDSWLTIHAVLQLLDNCVKKVQQN